MLIREVFNDTISIQGTNILPELSNYMKGTSAIIKDEDLELVSSCKKGNMDAFEQLVEKHQKRMLNIAYRMVGNYEEACEIVQDAFVSAYKSIQSFEGKSRFSTWLFTIVTNISRNRLKQMKARGHHERFSLDNPILTDDGNISVEPVSPEPSVLEKLEKRGIQQKVQECIQTLDNEFKEVIVLRDIQGFSYDEISDMLNLAGGTVKSRLFRARDIVRNCLKRFSGEI
jgi:RNA polymerase sigma-70 factor (ECF subfamily)